MTSQALGVRNTFFQDATMIYRIIRLERTALVQYEFPQDGD